MERQRHRGVPPARSLKYPLSFAIRIGVATGDWHNRRLLGAELVSALDAHHAAVAALRLPESTLHDHRHHYAVALRRRGVSDVVIAKQLGHSSTMLVATRYGRYQPEAAEVIRAAGGRKSAK